ncbi:MAG: hypothetical protein HY763_11585 [Planctomycetes bacterium]|nr:hypothetical protein [Planctomycetota bacterium]
MDDEAVIEQTIASDAFRVESAYLRRGGISVRARPRLFKRVDARFVRMIFPTDIREVDDGTVVGLVCLWDARENLNVYAHCISAGPGANAQLRALYSPLNQVKPQPGVDGDRAVSKFIAWKQAAWGRFLSEELELGATEASARWLASFWKALDRMYGGGHLRE